ncbi:MAG: carboxylating.nicotinate-nucleotide diphosphorylase, partial [Methanobrevibacter sp.]|nr:carboxylating.nicotinate-nucleotide diphosphorylase [Candidatus Methanovirga basalitermitum]
MKEIIKHIIEDDIGFEDITTNALISKSKIAEASIISKENGLIAGVGIAKEIFSYYDLNMNILRDDGDEIAVNDTIMEIEGNARIILS